MSKDWKSLLPSLREQSIMNGRPMGIADMLDEFWREPFPSCSGASHHKVPGYPAVDISETEQAITVRAELPGLEPKDVEIGIHDDILTIQGEKRFEEKDRKGDYLRIERSYGSFHRSIPLVAKVHEDMIKARFDKGILTVTMMKMAMGKGKSKRQPSWSKPRSARQGISLEA